MSKKRSIQIHLDDELAQIDEELDQALEQLETANVTVGELLGELEALNGQNAGAGDPPSAGPVKGTKEEIAESQESEAPKESE